MLLLSSKRICKHKPFPRSHIKYRIPFQVWYRRGKTSANLAVWSVLVPNTGTSQVPNENQSSQGPRGPTAQRNPCTRGNASATVANGHHHGKRPVVDTDTGRQRAIWNSVLSQNLSISSLAVVPKGTTFLLLNWGLRRAWRQWWPACLNKNSTILGSGLDGRDVFFPFSLGDLFDFSSFLI